MMCFIKNTKKYMVSFSSVLWLSESFWLSFLLCSSLLSLRFSGLVKMKLSRDYNKFHHLAAWQEVKFL
jgi:hypothetical protein